MKIEGQADGGACGTAMEAVLFRLPRWVIAGLCVLSAAAIAFTADAQDTPQGPDRERSARQEARQETSAQKQSVTRHSMQIEGARLDYVAVADTYEIGGTEDGDVKARIFFVAYERAEAEAAARPVTFVFNGGPGAASAYLHLLALGPRIMVLEEDGSIPPPPAKMMDNPHSWLEFTDLVFIDPVGTGFSRALGESGDGAGDRAPRGGGYWEVDKDLGGLAEFMRLYLTRNGRWDSPKFVAGESYGGFRAALLPGRLQSDPGIRLNGVVLVSPVLEFGLQDPGPYNVLPWAALLPSYAATAHYHGKLADERPLEKIVAEAENFAMEDYVAWLSQADITGERKAPPPGLARYLGLATDLVVRNDGRIPRYVFRKELLSGADRIVSLYDGSIEGIDPDPAGPGWRVSDPVLDGLTAPLNAAFSTYVRERLAYETDAAYKVLNEVVGRNWRWTGQGRGRPEPPGAAESLKEAMSLHDELMVFVGHGYYDLVTPYLASKYAVARMALDSAVRPNLVFEVYEGGHMYYMHAAAREAFHRDIRSFYEKALARRLSPKAGR